MLKVIAEDFIHPDAVDTVLPLYRELEIGRAHV